jgi:AAA+ superfamily predicted ATPase
VRERDELQRLMVSRFPVVYYDAREEQRAERMVIAAARACGRNVWTWSLSTGVVPIGKDGNVDDQVEYTTTGLIPGLQRIAEQPGDDVFIMRDAALAVEDEAIAQRILRDIARSGAGTTVVLLGAVGNIPESLRGVSAVLELPPPDLDMITSHVQKVLNRATTQHGSRNALTPDGFRQLADALRGLTLDEIDQVLLHLIHDDGQIDDAEVAEAVDQKARILARSGVLSLETPLCGLEWVAGLENVKGWVATRARAFGAEAKNYGISAPRGIMLTGVPGCGKSFIAKAISFDWNMPLLRLDGGSLYDGFIGASERNLREALRTAGALAPSVLWIDEIEKGFGSTGPAQSDGGLAYRLLGTLATWMQERPHPVFMIATSNDVTKLPPELLRQGRFDEIFFVDLPDLHAREHLYRMQLARAGRRYESFDCALLAERSEGFSGAEIEQSVTNGLYAAFGAGREIVTDDIAREIDATRPLSELDPLRIEKIRDWGTAHARPA